MIKDSMLAISRVCHTVPRLKPAQMIGRAHRLIRPLTVPGRKLNDEALTAEWRASAGPRPTISWGPLSDQSPDDVLNGVFELVGKRIGLEHQGGSGSRTGMPWIATEASHHWQKMLHSLDWLGCLPAEAGRELVREYCQAAGDLPARHMANDPWVVSFRIQSVIRYHAQFGLDAKAARAVANWCNLVGLNLEWRITGNHLIKDLVALCMAGRHLAGATAERWRPIADKQLVKLLKTDILADGGHEELSPMYHALVLYDLLDLLGYVDESEVLHVPLVAMSQRMSTFLKGTIHPDGNIANLNDSGFGLALEPAKLIERAVVLGAGSAEPGSGLRVYPSSGVAVIDRAPWWTIVDIGIPCVPHVPGHGHADMLTLEASYAGQRLFVDSGVSTYSNQQVRNWERSTAAHNTAFIEGCNSADVYGIHRMGRRAAVFDIDCRHTADGIARIAAAHDGYSYLRGRPLHSRSVEIGPDGTLVITDRILGRHNYQWGLHWYLHPQWRVAQRDVEDGHEGAALSIWELTAPGGQRVLANCSHQNCEVVRANVSLRFGYPEPTVCLRTAHILPGEVVTWCFRPLG